MATRVTCPFCYYDDGDDVYDPGDGEEFESLLSFQLHLRTDHPSFIERFLARLVADPERRTTLIGILEDDERRMTPTPGR
jgi:hypothetical protein